jgi:hypothetical protein
LRRLIPWLVVVGAALAYPLAVLAFSGAPDFPARSDCSRPPDGEGELQVVFGYRDSERDALELQGQVETLGFTGSDVQRDACGRVRVVVDDVPSRDVGEEVVREAESVGLSPILEDESDGG